MEKLSDMSEGRRTADVNDVTGRRRIKEDSQKSSSSEWPKKADGAGVDRSCEEVEAKLKDVRLRSKVPEWFITKAEDASASRPYKTNIIPQKMDETAVNVTVCSSNGDFSKNELTSVSSGKDSTEKLVDAGRDKAGSEETAAYEDDEDFLVAKKKGTPSEQSSKMRDETDNMQNREKALEEIMAKNSGLQQLEEELEMLRAAVRMAFDEEHPVDYYLEQLNEKVEAKKHNLVELELKWEAVKESLEEKKRSLEESLCGDDPEAQEKLQKLREVDLEKQSILSAIRKRKEEHSKLSAQLERQPKVASRGSYIERIKEITKNLRKQDADIERILKETREIQLESNSIQERLHRSYAVVDEIVFREAKKDPVGRQAYRLLTSFHERFEQISEKIMASDRLHREAIEHEKKLAAMASRSLNVDKLQADLDAIRKENEYLRAKRP